MSRPLRIEYPGACYHVGAHGNGGQPIFTCAEDGARFLAFFGREVAQQRWICHGWCLMETHYQLLLETPEANLGRGMGRLNMAYSQWFGRRHGRPGHLFGSRYRTVLFEKESWLAPLARHMVLSPVRAGLVRRPDQWHWSSHRALLADEAPSWFAADAFLTVFGTTPAAARAAWSAYVADGADAAAPWEKARGGHYLGRPEFLRAVAERIRGRPLGQVSRDAAVPDRPTTEAVLAAVAGAAGVPPALVLDRRRAPEAWRAAVYLLRRACNLPLSQTAAIAGVSPARISQIQRRIEDAGGLVPAFRWAAPLETLMRG
jgi:hypothetical protein